MTNPILVEIYRENVLESFHRGSLCIVDENEQIIFSKGNPDQLCYPRSAMKLLQVIPLLELNGMKHFGFTLEEISLMCGSHNAEEDHLRVLDSILKKIDCTFADLACGAQWPTDKKAADQLLLKGQKPGPQHNNCSGKHAGMLALCKLMGHATQNYIAPEHPIQQLIRTLCAEMYGLAPNQLVTALDGCSAPIFAVPVKNQAIAYSKLCGKDSFSKERNAALEIVRNAVSSYPFMVAGSKRYCTDMMKVTAPRVIGKTGAEGVFCMSFTQQKWGVCIKIDDGKMQPQYAVAQQLLNECKLFTSEQLAPLAHYATAPIKNFNAFTCGEMKAVKLNFPNLGM